MTSPNCNFKIFFSLQNYQWHEGIWDPSSCTAHESVEHCAWHFMWDPSSCTAHESVEHCAWHLMWDASSCTAHDTVEHCAWHFCVIGTGDVLMTQTDRHVTPVTQSQHENYVHRRQVHSSHGGAVLTEHHVSSSRNMLQGLTTLFTALLRIVTSNSVYPQKIRESLLIWSKHITLEVTLCLSFIWGTGSSTREYFRSEMTSLYREFVIAYVVWYCGLLRQWDASRILKQWAAHFTNTETSCSFNRGLCSK
jgi:hypothetical protein